MIEPKRLSLNEFLIKYFFNMDEEDIKDKVKEVFDPPPHPINDQKKNLGIDYSYLPSAWRCVFDEYELHKEFVEKMLKNVLLPSSYSIYSYWIDMFLKLKDLPIYLKTRLILSETNE